jgi:hypothetical protein
VTREETWNVRRREREYEGNEIGRKKGRGNKIRKRQNTRSDESRRDEIKRRNKIR